MIFKNLFLFFVLFFGFLSTQTHAAWMDVPFFKEMGASKPGKPLNHTFFRRKAGPIFLEVGPDAPGNPFMHQLNIRLKTDPTVEVPTAPKKGDFPTVRMFKEAQSVHQETLRGIYRGKSCPYIGYLNLFFLPKEDGQHIMHVAQLFIEDDYRGKGYGTHALLTALSTAKAKHPYFVQFRLGVLMGGPCDQRLLAFYKRLGFACSGTPFPVENSPFLEQAMVLSRDAYDPHKEGIFNKHK